MAETVFTLNTFNLPLGQVKHDLYELAGKYQLTLEFPIVLSMAENHFRIKLKGTKDNIHRFMFQYQTIQNIIHNSKIRKLEKEKLRQ